MKRNDREYFRRRAEEELKSANTVTHPAAKAIHAELAEGYATLANLARGDADTERKDGSGGGSATDQDGEEQ